MHRTMHIKGVAIFIGERNYFPETSFFSCHLYATLLWKSINVTRGAHSWAEREVYAS